MIRFRRLFAEGLRHPIAFIHVIRYLPHYFKLFWRLLKDPRMPISPKLLLLLALIYVVSPFDFLPDMIPFIGQLDDLFILLMTCKHFLNNCPKNVLMEHVHQIEDEKRKS
ncbi:DUF1232 domain-containing protein [candidate division KSB1 bacterium]|nr:DUF1232 domain-containing protein [candidate division KSB1 bacterium]NIR72829.1 DUF1232 domain-containing protein [candidate division KSB1 bacterium]NIS26869.1 DUF1232 domain-containing protein [candidate division KSB1 bacterium]NIT73665.1 DUF1232 domain-containing protein [candidate division KSB1 bacterium]NIU27536.1 DUF1232 domain-containing protein [candidate division KSB1 bacterium]